jgi:hypothetical protein
MTHIFISYSRRDVAYVRKLVDSLLERGFDVWFDAHIEYGDNWESAIIQAIDQAALVVVIMSPNAAQSAWVPREIAYAENQHKPVFPLLLAGEVFPRLILTQFADVRAGNLPRDEFYAALGKILPPKAERGSEVHIDQPPLLGFARPAQSPSTVQERRLESAMPHQSARGIPTEVRVKISKLDTVGLRGELPDLTEYGDEIKKDDVRAATFPLTFPRGEDGALLPINACIQVASEQYSVQYPTNACGESAAQVEIQPAHDTRTIIFTLLPKDAAYIGRAAVTVRLLQDGRVIAENMVITRVTQEITEVSFSLASALVPAPAAASAAAPTAVTRASKRVEMSAPSAPTVSIDKRLTAPSPTPQRVAPSAAAPAPPPARARKSGGGLRLGGLLGILIAGIVGTLVVTQNGLRQEQSPPVANISNTQTQDTGASTMLPPQATPTQTAIRGFVGGENASGDSPLRVWVGDPRSGLDQEGQIDLGTPVTILSKAQIENEWYYELQIPDNRTVWLEAEHIALSAGAAQDDIPDWEA